MRRLHGVPTNASGPRHRFARDPTVVSPIPQSQEPESSPWQVHCYLHRSPAADLHSIARIPAHMIRGSSSRGGRNRVPFNVPWELQLRDIPTRQGGGSPRGSYQPTAYSASFPSGQLHRAPACTSCARRAVSWSAAGKHPAILANGLSGQDTSRQPCFVWDSDAWLYRAGGHESLPSGSISGVSNGSANTTS